MMKKERFGPVELLVLQDSPFCNINCKYSYLPDRLNKKRISQDTIRKTINHLRHDGLLGSSISLVWHAGEPLAVPLSFYRDTFEQIDLEMPGEVTVNHHLQTNAMLLNDDWCEFIRERDIRVGVSIDGPRQLNDFN